MPNGKKGLELLFKAGEISSPNRNEFVLFSDVLGISSLVDMVHSPDDGTPSSVLGPFHIMGAPELPFGGDLKKYNDGEPLIIGGRILDTKGMPIEGADLEVWQTSHNGLYSGQDEEQSEYNLRARMTTGAEGRYLFSTVRPAPYTVPDDGPVGELLHATGRHPWRPAHIHFIISKGGFRTLVTEMFPNDDPYLDEDAVFGVREKLLLDFQYCHSTDGLPDELEIKGRLQDSFLKVDFDFVLCEDV